MIKNTLFILRDNCNNSSCRNSINTYIYNLSKVDNSRFKFLTRQEYLDMI